MWCRHSFEEPPESRKASEKHGPGPTVGPKQNRTTKTGPHTLIGASCWVDAIAGHVARAQDAKLDCADARVENVFARALSGFDYADAGCDDAPRDRGGASVKKRAVGVRDGVGRGHAIAAHFEDEKMSTLGGGALSSRGVEPPGNARTDNADGFDTNGGRGCFRRPHESGALVRPARADDGGTTHRVARQIQLQTTEVKKTPA